MTRQAARWVPVVEDFDDEAGDRAWAMLALGLAEPRRADHRPGADRGFRRSRHVARQAPHRGCWSPGLPGWGGSTPQVAGRLNARYRLGLDRKTAWTGLIDGAAMRRQAGTAMLLAASAMQAPAIGDVPALYMFHAVTALRRTGQEGVARMIAAEALARSVTERVNGRRPRAGRPLPRHDGGGERARRAIRWPPIAATWRRRRRDLGSLEAARSSDLAMLGERWGDAGAVDGGAAGGGAAALLRLPARRGAARRRSVAGAAAPDAAAAACPRSSTRTRSRRCSPRSRSARRAAGRWRCATSR